jgi:hypothetical protein
VELFKKKCGGEIKEFLYQKFHQLGQFSQEATVLMVPLYKWHITKWEAYPKIDVAVKTPDDNTMNLEIKYISNLLEQKSNLKQMILKTRIG